MLRKHMTTNSASKFEVIREAADHELPLIRQVHIQAFGGRGNEASLVKMLCKTGKARPSLVATIDGTIVANVVFSPVVIDDAPDIEVAGLGPIGVLPACQRRGIGSRLINSGLAACLANQYDAVVVLGDPRFYRRFGFLPATDYGLTNEYVKDDHFMIRELRSDALSRVKGLVRYAPEFRLAGC